jgi:ATP-binding cassette, subfamily B, bacterial
MSTMEPRRRSLIAESWSALRLAWEASRSQLALTVGAQALASASMAGQLLVGREVVRALARSLAQGAGFAPIAPWLAALAIVTTVGVTASALQAGAARLLTELMIRHARERLLRVSAHTDLAEFERPSFQDALRRAFFEGIPQTISLATGLTTAAAGVAGTLSVAFVMATVSPFLLGVLLAVVPLSIAANRNSRETAGWSFGHSPEDRVRGALESILTELPPAKEIRSFDLSGFILERWRQHYLARIQGARELAGRRTRRSVSAGLASAAVIAGTVTALTILVLAGRLDAGGAAIAAIAALQLGGQITAITNGFGQLHEAALFLADLNAFMGRYERPAPTVVSPPFGHVRVEGLRYRYPDSAGEALCGVDIEIKRGEIVALVGENGSGKTTLAKLLAGLYAPAAGRITWEGAVVSELGVEGVRDRVAVLFQDFVHYPLSAAENISAGRSDAADRTSIESAARAAGAAAFLDLLPLGYDTTLARAFEGGTDLSGGQWQRIALARAFHRNTPFVILDEPTAALDPRSEYELFRSLRDLFKGRSVLLISHRFSSVRTADRIYVLHAGRVIEHGSHAELLAMDGRYAELYRLQAAAYLEDAGAAVVKGGGDHDGSDAATPPPAPPR